MSTLSPESTTTTIEPNVNYKTRKFTDIFFGILYVLNFIGFVVCGAIIVKNSHHKYDIDAETGDRTISQYYYNDALECCTPTSDSEKPSSYGICYHFNDLVEYDDPFQMTMDDGDDQVVRQRRGRYLQAGNSRFDGDEGIFDAFLEAPEIIVGLLGLTVGITIIWALLLRYFSKPVVFVTEAVKIGALIALAVYQEDQSSRIVFILLAIALAIYTWFCRIKIILAAKMIEQSVIALSKNPAVFLGGIFTKLLFAGNAALFVFFFSKSFDVAEVEKGEQFCSTDFNSGVTTCSYSCHFVYPDYVEDIGIYLGVSYLWTIMLLASIRLSIISTIIGSWHFHPSDVPSVFLSIRNTIYSFGTLALSSLIAGIAEKLNRMINRPSCAAWCSPACCVLAPLQILLCFFGTCFKGLIQMLTKYAVILHTFTGNAFVPSGKDAFGILSRHFVGGFVTEVSSQSVLTLASYAFSFGITMLTWIWIDDRFDCQSFPSNAEDGNSTGMFILYTFFVLFNLWFPVLGIYIMILVNRILSSENDLWSGMQNLWIPPLASIFVGCIAMMFFLFLSHIFLDTINVKFMCYAIDKENKVENESNKEFEMLLKNVEGYIEATDVQPVKDGWDTENGQSSVPIATAIPVRGDAEQNV